MSVRSAGVCLRITTRNKENEMTKRLLLKSANVSVVSQFVGKSLRGRPFLSNRCRKDGRPRRDAPTNCETTDTWVLSGAIVGLLFLLLIVPATASAQADDPPKREIAAEFATL